ncbi:TerC family protein [Bacillus sp. HMF5848]|uniref:TerC family protein n=1 Tax=Bacillus sp. HMF5848 TaxID=2495421 RepID=UPI000F766C5C|nr:TerC family protein [Bacillus sp. HMF5848]RSK26484.1 TerC family protein [Bacillus sp. HMF5848]
MEIETLLSILLIIGIDILLGGDNAIMIALASRNLPENKRNIVIVAGTALAIIVRVSLTVVAVYLLTIPYLHLIGGVLLLYIAFKLLVEDNDESERVSANNTVLGAIGTIVAADILMGLDNVLAIAGAADGNTALVVAGLLISIPIIIWGSKFILYAMDRYPIIIYIGSAILAVSAGRMITGEQQLSFVFDTHESLLLLIPTVAAVATVLLGYITNRVKSQA